jgi:hypothetical protein
MATAADDVLEGTIVGVNVVRVPRPGTLTQLGPLLVVTGYQVQLSNGTEVTAVNRLPPLKHSFMLRSVRAGTKVKVALGTATEPVRIIYIEPEP